MLKKTSLALLLCAGSLFAQNFVVKGPENPKPYEKTAVEELTSYLTRRLADGTLTIDGKSPITFQVGDTELAKANGITSEGQPAEKWFIKSIGNQVILNGGGTHGALYATYHFLEDYCGIHWWNDFEDYVPKASSLELPKIDVSKQPTFFMRDMYIGQSGKDNAWLRARVRMNGGDGVPSLPELGGTLRFGPPAQCHTFDHYFPAKEYLATHPEYFSLVNGKRVGGQMGGQLCLTNPELKSEFLKKLLANIKKCNEDAKAKGIPAPKVFEVSMNDNHNRCQCDNCKAEEEKYNPSGLYVNFINELAAEVTKQYPGTYLSTLAYFYNEPAPKGGVRASDNVIIRLCDTKTNQAASILEPCNKVIVDFLKDWQDHCSTLFIWDYAITFTRNLTGLPFASEWHYADLFRTYYENKVRGFFWEHENPHMADMWELKFFLESKLMEDPYQDNVKLIQTFMDCYYGDAAPYIIEYRKILDQIRKERNGHISWFPGMAAFKFIETDELLKFEELFDKAENAVAGDKTLFRRVRHARTGVDRLICARCGKSGIFHGKRKFIDSPFDNEGAMNRLEESWPDWARQFHGGQKLADEVTGIIGVYRGSTGKKLPPPEEFKDRNFYDFYAPSLAIYGGDYIKLVNDDKTPVGKSVKIDADHGEHYKLPFGLGFYDEGNKKTLTSRSYKNVPDQDGFSWFSGGKAKIAEDGYVFLTRSWCVSLKTNVLQQLTGNEYEIFVSARFDGPFFRPGQTGESHIYIDRVLLVEPQE